ncbi:CvpA family protein [Sediminibacterium roseum]|uniref:CvpA family protein n=1 Tax=Sediminibacterium roseum TaxID=1978412 RepID=A0ABW9ZPK4_9BACT|nr:CvpA family protein [Sediminibacterium roseum]NCI48412.1 CvpA family protein [Sediminibacterium roseum]
MLIDSVFAILMVIAIFKGLRKGFVVAVFSFLAIIIGIAAAMKLATVVADWLKDSTNISSAWLPFLSFALVMIGVVILVRIGASMIESAMKMVMLGWVNKLAGIVLFAALYTTVYSVVLFYADKMHWIKPETFAASGTYSFIKPWGPKAIDLFGSVIPWFKGMFDEMSQFFDGVHARVKQ